MVKIQQIGTIGSQVLRHSILSAMDAVYRLNGSGFHTMRERSLRYSRALPKGSLLEECLCGRRAKGGMQALHFGSHRGEPAEGSLNLSITTPCTSLSGPSFPSGVWYLGGIHLLFGLGSPNTLWAVGLVLNQQHQSKTKAKDMCSA